MLTDYFSCYKLYKTSIPLPRREKILPNFKFVKFSMLSEFWDIQTLVFINFKKKKKYFFLFFSHAVRKYLALIILVQLLQSIITYVVCSTSLRI